MAVKSLAQSSLVIAPPTNSLLGRYQPNAFHHLETVRLSGNTSIVDFTNLARYNDYQHLQLRMLTKSTRASANDDPIVMRFNSDSNSANYRYHILYGNGSSIGTDGNSGFIYGGAGSSTTSSFGAMVTDILDPFDTVKNTTTRTLGGVSPQLTTFSSSAWFSTAAVTSISVASFTSSSFIAGSRFALYGIKARS